MPLFLTEDDVARLLTMDDALRAVEEAFRQHGQGSTVNRPRTRVRVPQGILHVMAAGLPPEGVLGFKAYTAFGGTVRFHVHLYSAEDGRLLALMEADRLGQIRTGAASGVATRYLARPDASVVGIFGTGWQARSQLQAVCAVRTITDAKVFSPTPEHRQSVAEKMSRELKIDVRPAKSPEEALEDADVVIAVTNSRTPVFDGNSLRDGAHVTSISNGDKTRTRQEIDETTIRRSDLLYITSKETVCVNESDIFRAVRDGVTSWERVYEIGDLLLEKAPARTSDKQITLYKLQGIGIMDVAVGLRAYERLKNDPSVQRF